jgi:uncharacterized membrane protein YphA (DoxX/SURF4 family)
VAWSDRALAFLDGDDPGTQLSKVRAFEWIFALIVCTEYWVRATFKPNDLGLNYSVSLPLISALGVATLSARWGRLAFAGLAIVQSVRIWNDFPVSGNHSYLELLLCILCASLNVRDQEERKLFLRAVRWMSCVVFFYAGVQKFVHGYYFRGQLLLYSIGIETFRPVLQLLLPHADFVRLSQYRFQAGDGPFLVSSPLIVVLSNATYIIEIGLAVLLLLRRTRPFAVIGAIVFLVCIESAARELFFGLIYINMLLLFLERDVNRRLLGVFGAALGCLLLVRLKVLPEFIFY